VLGVFADYCSEGMIPNRFDDYTNEPSYNTVDASLWFIHACFEFLKASRDSSTFETKLLPACRAIIKGYRQGTRFHIKMDPADGLISQGDPTTQLTWMDAKCNNVVFTPRQGKAVEINALWYHALRLLNETELADRVQRSFVKTFWISPFRGLCDVVNGGNGRDVKIRPNQIFAVSLEHSALSLDQQHAVVEVVRRELLTSYGLRTLSPGDPHFHARYDGDQFHRDAAYHNGTIWPWLIGGFLEAYLRVNNRSAESIDQAKAWLKPLLDAMDTHGAIGQISEIYEAEPPHRPAGCFAQAWSVAEVLRIAAMINM
jgi:predicted glycogen debranching enzyme